MIVFLLIILVSGNIRDVSLAFDKKESCEKSSQSAMARFNARHPKDVGNFSMECRPLKIYSVVD